ncbi:MULTISPECIES: DAPG hydrolase family protein [Burkholderia cepacia complex]|uniref:DAPG hydrolase family protein n=1 Tax=Burkholderia cepacia complex TaxID=87882 RepID=UPI0013DE3F99|nr:MULTISPECIES: hypothetical protein [Burkholderia cepacia complex]
MKLEEVGQLLNPAPLRMETGYERLENGVLHVACRTDLHNCTVSDSARPFPDADFAGA